MEHGIEKIIKERQFLKVCHFLKPYVDSNKINKAFFLKRYFERGNNKTINWILSSLNSEKFISFSFKKSDVTAFLNSLDLEIIHLEHDILYEIYLVIDIHKNYYVLCIAEYSNYKDGLNNEIKFFKKIKKFNYNLFFYDKIKIH